METISPKLKPQRNWTKDETEACKRMWAEGKSAADIGKELGRTRDSVIGKWWRLGLSEDQRHAVHLLDAEGDHCRYPLWDDEGINGHGHGNRLMVCGKRGYPWCPKHKAIVFEKASKRKRDAQVIEAERSSGTKRIFG